jgi:transcriptional regulator with XRE-family HTH domain
VQLAELLGVSQQTITAYEVGQRRIQVSALPVIARALQASIEELIGEDGKRTGKRGPASKLQQQLDQVSQLPGAQQKFVSAMLDIVLQQAAHWAAKRQGGLYDHNDRATHRRSHSTDLAGCATMAIR